jgi:hypothetical protein
MDSSAGAVDDFFAGARLAAAFFAAGRAGARLAGDFLAAAFLAGAFFAGDFLAALFLAGDFLAGALLAAVFLVAVFLAAVRLGGEVADVAAAFLGSGVLGVVLSLVSTVSASRSMAALVVTPYAQPARVRPPVHLRRREQRGD